HLYQELRSDFGIAVILGRPAGTANLIRLLLAAQIVAGAGVLVIESGLCPPCASIRVFALAVMFGANLAARSLKISESVGDLYGVLFTGQLLLTLMAPEGAQPLGLALMALTHAVGYLAAGLS